MRVLIHLVVILYFYSGLTRESTAEDFSENVHGILSRHKRQNNALLFQALRSPALQTVLRGGKSTGSLDLSRLQDLIVYIPAIEGRQTLSDGQLMEFLTKYPIDTAVELYKLYVTLFRPGTDGDVKKNRFVRRLIELSTAMGMPPKSSNRPSKVTTTKRPKGSKKTKTKKQPTSTTPKSVKAIEYRPPPKQNPDNYPLITTSNGIIRGLPVEEDGLKYYSFRGVPYAEKPQRFKAPQPLKSWEGIKDATKEKEPCFQYDNYIGMYGGSEDCLYMNIFTPTLNYEESLPVVVWIHGGSFKQGTPSQIAYGPQRFLAERVVVVNIAYRLGALGFLSTNTHHAPGNAGLKDVVYALRWLQNNVHMFGGNNFNVCLYGVSTGAGIIEYLTMSPMGYGLFHKAILHSGSTLSTHFFAADPLKSAFKLGGYLGNQTRQIEDLMSVLQKADPVDIVKYARKMDLQENPTMSTFTFTPTVEKYIQGEERFLCDTPETLLKTGRYLHVPSMIGFNRDEGLIIFSDIDIDVPTYLKSMNDIFEYWIMNDLHDCIADNNLKKYIIDQVKQFYFNGSGIGMDTMQNFIDMVGDIRFTFGVQRSVYYKSKHLQAPIYYYKFAYDGSLGLSKSYISDKIASGVAHADDVPYLFKIAFSEPAYNNDLEARTVSKSLVTLYTNFMKYGNPTPYITETIPITWQPINNTSLPYLEITNRLTMKMDPNLERFAFWSHIYTLVNRM